MAVCRLHVSRGWSRIRYLKLRTVPPRKRGSEQIRIKARFAYYLVMYVVFLPDGLDCFILLAGETRHVLWFHTFGSSFFVSLLL